MDETLGGFIGPGQLILRSCDWKSARRESPHGHGLDGRLGASAPTTSTPRSTGPATGGKDSTIMLSLSLSISPDRSEAIRFIRAIRSRLRAIRA